MRTAIVTIYLDVISQEETKHDIYPKWWGDGSSNSAKQKKSKVDTCFLCVSGMDFIVCTILRTADWFFQDSSGKNERKDRKVEEKPFRQPDSWTRKEDQFCKSRNEDLCPERESVIQIVTFLQTYACIA